MPILAAEMDHGGGSVHVSSLPRVKTLRMLQQQQQQQRLRRHSLMASLEVCRVGGGDGVPAVEAGSQRPALVYFKYYKGYYDVRKLQRHSVSSAISSGASERAGTLFLSVRASPLPDKGTLPLYSSARCR